MESVTTKFSLAELSTLNRKRLKEILPPASLAVVNSNDIMPSNADGTLKYRPNNDVYWLTGITQEETTYLLFPDHPEKDFRELLFVRKVDQHFVKWHGKRHTLEEAREISGIRNIFWDHQFKAVFKKLALAAENIYLNIIEHHRSENIVQTKDHRFIEWVKEEYPLHTFKRLAPLLSSLRITKSEMEIELMQHACNISEKGFRRILKFITPGIAAKKIQAELIHEYLQYDGDWADYQPIIASGENSCILHYITNENICKDGDILLIDAAASYKLYNADLTRTFPVNGKYSARQKEVYNAALRVHKSIKNFVKPGLILSEIQDHHNLVMLDELQKLGLCSAEEIKSKGARYFLDKHCYHGFGHLLGLDLHDVGNIYEPLKAGAVFTNEPGIYIQDEKIGVRIENNLLLKENGAFDLMENIPIEAEEIEDLMN